MRICSVDGCDRPYYARSFCSRHYGQFQKHGDPLVMGRTGRPPTDDPTFNTVHRRLHKARGFAKEWDCVDCGGVALDWSLTVTGGPLMRESPEGFAYSLDLGDYMPRCRRCHVRYDRRSPTAA